MSSESSFSTPNEGSQDAVSRRRDDMVMPDVQSGFSESEERSSVSISIPSADASDNGRVDGTTDVNYVVRIPAAETVPEKPESDAVWQEGGENEDGGKERVTSGSESTTLEMEVRPTIRVSDGLSSTGNSSTEGETIVASEPKVSSSESPEKRALPSLPDDGLQINGMFGQFRIVRFVGGGGMGHVYEAFDCDLERKVAIKVLPKKKAADEGVVARFLNEAKSSARLNHENIAQVYLFGNVSGVPYIAFEYVEGVNLRDYVRNNGVLELSVAIDYILQTASALSHAATHGVTHRDVKPSNIIVTPQKRVKLIDMGLARLLRSDAVDDLTESGVTLGTFDYISPEQAKDPRLADVRSDVYSLGCTFYYILTGSPPFPNGTMLQKLLQHQGNEAPDVRELNPSIPAEIAAVVKKMMKKNPDDRYQTPDLLIEDLLQIVEMLGLNVADRGYIDAKEQKKSPTTIPPKAIPAVGACLLLLSFVATLYLSDSGSDLNLPIVESPQVADISGQEDKVGPADEGVVKSSESGAGVVSVENASGGDSTEGVDVGNSTTVAAYSGVDYGVEGSDEIYEFAYGSSIEKNPAVLTEETPDVLRSFIVNSVNAASQRVAFGWRASAIAEDTSKSGTDDEVTKTSLTFTVSVGEKLAGMEGLSYASSIYPLLGTALTSTTTSADKSETTRVVDGKGEGPNTYASLQAALNASTSDEIVHVELKFNDSMETTPVSLVDRKVEIFASQGYRPTLVFKPSESTDGGWGERMFLLDSSSLTMRGVDVDFTVPSLEVVSSEWSVFEAYGASELSLSESTITVCNMTGSDFTAPLHSNVAFFRASDDSLLNSVFESQTSQVSSGNGAEVFNVRLDRVLARGEATLFNVEKYGGRYEAQKSGFNISGPFLQYSERESSLSDSTLRFTLELDQDVVISRSCLVRFDFEMTRDASRSGEPSREDNSLTTESESGTEALYTVTRKLPQFEVKGTNSIFCFDKQALALITSPAVVDLESFDNEWTLNGLVALDVASFWRRRSSRTDEWQDYAFDPNKHHSESSALADLNVDAHERIEHIPPHEFSAYDFSNWILNPIHTASNLSNDSKAVGDMVKKEFVDTFFD